MHAACVLARTSECSQARADSPWRVQSVTDHAAAVRQGHAAGLAGILGRRPADGVAVLDRDPCARCTGKRAANAPIFTCRARHHCCPVRGAVTKLLPPRAVRDDGIDSHTWSDHTDIRPTIMLLTGLKDDYSHDGRVLSEAMTGAALPATIRGNANIFRRLAASYKQINAAVGQFGLGYFQLGADFE